MTVPSPEPTPAPQPAPTPPPAPNPAPSPAPASPNGFPENTPWRDMTAPEQAAYWRHQARKTEQQRDEYKTQIEQIKPKAEQFDALDEASKTEAQREIDRLKAENEQTKAALAEQARTFGARLVEQKLAAVAPDKGLDAAAMTRIAGDPGRFLAADGSVNEDALQDFLALIPDRGDGTPPPPPARSGLGGGRRSLAPALSGADLWAQMHPPKKTSA